MTGSSWPLADRLQHTFIGALMTREDHSAALRAAVAAYVRALRLGGVPCELVQLNVRGIVARSGMSQACVIRRRELIADVDKWCREALASSDIVERR